MDALRDLLTQIKAAAEHSSKTSAGEMSNRLCDVVYLAERAERIIAEIEAGGFILMGAPAEPARQNRAA